MNYWLWFFDSKPSESNLFQCAVSANELLPKHFWDHADLEYVSYVVVDHKGLSVTNKQIHLYDAQFYILIQIMCVHNIATIQSTSKIYISKKIPFNDLHTAIKVSGKLMCSVHEQFWLDTLSDP